MIFRISNFFELAVLILLLTSPIVVKSATLNETMKLAAFEAFDDWKHLVTDLDEDCISFEFRGPVKVNSALVVDVDMREIHNEKCGGDPQSAPLAGSIKLEFTNASNLEKVFVFDIITGTYILVDALR